MKNPCDHNGDPIEQDDGAIGDDDPTTPYQRDDLERIISELNIRPRITVRLSRAKEK